MAVKKRIILEAEWELFNKNESMADTLVHTKYKTNKTIRSSTIFIALI